MGPTPPPTPAGPRRRGRRGAWHRTGARYREGPGTPRWPAAGRHRSPDRPPPKRLGEPAPRCSPVRPQRRGDAIVEDDAAPPPKRIRRGGFARHGDGTPGPRGPGGPRGSLREPRPRRARRGDRTAHPPRDRDPCRGRHRPRGARRGRVRRREDPRPAGRGRGHAGAVPRGPHAGRPRGHDSARCDRRPGVGPAVRDRGCGDPVGITGSDREADPHREAHTQADPEAPRVRRQGRDTCSRSPGGSVSRWT
jgi:hypothetical protein